MSYQSVPHYTTPSMFCSICNYTYKSQDVNKREKYMKLHMKMTHNIINYNIYHNDTIKCFDINNKEINDNSRKVKRKNIYDKQVL